MSRYRLVPRLLSRVDPGTHLSFGPMGCLIIVVEQPLVYPIVYPIWVGEGTVLRCRKGGGRVLKHYKEL